MSLKRCQRTKRQSPRKARETELVARTMVTPYLRHAIVLAAIADKSIAHLANPQFTNLGLATKTGFALVAEAGQCSKGDLRIASDLLTTQALTLDAIFSEMARRSAINLGDYPDASERYLRLALKAQAGSRATLEALARLYQPREQTVKHVHVNEGGQAVVADNFHQHAGGREKNGKSNEQSHATGAPSECTSLPSPDPSRDGVPIPGCQREAAMQNARRDESGTVQGQP